MSDNVTPVQDLATELRSDIQCLVNRLKDFADGLKSGDIAEEGEKTNKGEQIANAMLSYRHLEDAKMRLGMVIKATVGVSVYDTPAEPEEANSAELAQPEPDPVAAEEEDNCTACHTDTPASHNCGKEDQEKGD